MTWIRDLRALSRHRHLVLSPHVDDAALSLGGTIATLTDRGEPVVVVTICGGLPSPFAQFSKVGAQLGHAASSPFEYVLLRREEERRALAHLGADHYFASTLDAIDRIPDRLHEVRDLFRQPPAADLALRQTRALLFCLARLAPRAQFWAPLAIGGHIDHRLVFSAARAMIDPTRLLFYEDFPYCADAGARGARLSELPELEPTTLDIGHRLKARVAAIAEYRSQLANLFGGRAAMERAVRRDAGAPARERFWRPTVLRPPRGESTRVRAADAVRALTPRG